MNSARERAVEAGARSDAEFDGRDWNGMGRADRERYLARARKSQGAAFPILAEELVAWHDEQANAAERYAKQAPTLAVRQQWEFVADTHRSHAATLRARIQQMAEAGHE